MKPLLTRVVLRNYKSIANCSVELGALVFFIGPNGSGKSNFLDALRFVADALRTSLDHALRDRGGIQEVRRRSGGHPTRFGVRLEFQLPSGSSGYYSFRIGALPRGAFHVQQEACEVKTQALGEPAFFKVTSGNVESSFEPKPIAPEDRLFLVSVSGLPGFREVYEAFSHMGFYNLNPDELRELQPPDAGDLLTRDGSNVASVLAQMNPNAKRRVEEYLAQVVPGIRGVDSKIIGPKETLEFKQSVAGAPSAWRFLASSMSDGTLRGLGILVALFQSQRETRHPIPLIGIEEPEIALHPHAAGILLDSLREASASTQVLVTSHSPDLLDNKDIDPSILIAVVAEEGVTKLAPVDEVGRSALREHLYTAGELLRLDQVRPDPKALEYKGHQLSLFDKA